MSFWLLTNIGAILVQRRISKQEVGLTTKKKEKLFLFSLNFPNGGRIVYINSLAIYFMSIKLKQA